jgi:hypothetical protein
MDQRRALRSWPGGSAKRFSMGDPSGRGTTEDRRTTETDRTRVTAIEIARVRPWVTGETIAAATEIGRDGARNRSAPPRRPGSRGSRPRSRPPRPRDAAPPTNNPLGSRPAQVRRIGCVKAPRRLKDPAEGRAGPGNWGVTTGRQSAGGRVMEAAMLSTATGPRWSPGRCSWDIDRPISTAARGGFAGRVLDESDLRGVAQLASVVTNRPTSGTEAKSRSPSGRV